MSKPSRTQAILARLLPTAALFGLALWTIAGPNGLLELRDRWKQEETARAEWAGLEQDNARLVLENTRLRVDPVVLERRLAAEQRLVRPGTTLFVFDDDRVVERVR